ncbi:MAG: cytochrome c oxidase subunit 3 [Planctomycetota bacterium]|nr:cytochrome c oxidase subunit 3 [Planctomycetota bacterium]
MPVTSNPQSRPLPHASHRASIIGMWLFLAALAMLFIASILGYILIRLHLAGTSEPQHLGLPWGTWVSTAVLLAGSYTIHRAVYNVRLERLNQLNAWLRVTLVLAIAFLVIQFPCLVRILADHRKAHAMNNNLYGLIFCLIVLHALHVVGGVVFLSLVTYKASRQVYDHENYLGVRHAAVYWHFLDVVWIVMFAMFTLTA